MFSLISSLALQSVGFLWYSYSFVEVSDPTQDKTPKLEEKEKPVRAEEPLHAEKAKGEKPVTEFEAKLNKYGFIHVTKKALPSLPFEAEKTLTARIEREALVIRKA